MTTLPDAPWRQHPGLAALVTALGGGESVRFVGGAVRDTLLGAPVHDIDVATRLHPEDVIARLEAAGIKAVPTGLAHGTVTAVSQGQVVEVTTLRRDVSTDGRHATVAFTDDWREDAMRRDFTINALYGDPETGQVSDYFGGLDDLSAGRVAFIGAPLERIAEDHLRILRFFRFHARFGRGAPDAAAFEACTARANDLMALSRERIADELVKLLACAAPVPSVRLMLAAGILAPVIPEIESADALERLIEREAAAGLTGDPVRHLAALIGPRPPIAERISARLKFSNTRIKRLTAAATPPAPMAPKALAYRRGVEGAIDALLLGPYPIEAVGELANWQAPPFPISGGDLIARGLVPGPIVAKTRAAIESAWVDAGFPSGEALEALVSRALADAVT